VSVGVASVPHSRIHTSKELIVAADKALYRAKRNGRNQVQAERRKEQRAAAVAKRPEGALVEVAR
jgi:predicted signal transduction protein with EAL and GGDEF domain